MDSVRKRGMASVGRFLDWAFPRSCRYAQNNVRMAACCDKSTIKEARQMEEIYVGIDIHRDYGVACVQDTKEKTVDEFRFGNDIEGINKVKEKLGGSTTHIAIESTGNMWVVLWDKLEESESDLHLVHPLKTKAIASNKLKNDKLDAKMLAKLLRACLNIRS